ncbi:MAG: hypothetical protein WC713_05120, partial [Candidatus Methylomirabilota bacterium]
MTRRSRPMAGATAAGPDYRLYLVTDPDLLGGRPLGDVVRDAVDGGATLVQVREKRGSSRRYL